MPGHNGPVTATAWTLLGLAAVAALANWWSHLTHHRVTEVVSKPLTLVSLIGAAVALEPADPTVRAWFVAGLVASLAGDVLLLDDRRFVAGLAAFLAGHVAYTAGFVAGGLDTAGLAVAALVGLLVVGGTAGVRVVRGAAATRPALGPPVVAYLLVISVMTLTAWASGNAFAQVGATLFLASDTVLGWRAFVAARPWMPVTVMVTYHLAQAGLVLSLV